MEEEWKPIIGWPEYMVSSYGRVYSIRTDTFLIGGKDTNGYPFVLLSVNGCKKCPSVHRLVAEAFVPGCFEGAEVNHINGIKTNNVFWNLEWLSRGDNVRHAISTGLKQKLCKAILIVETEEVFSSLEACARHINGNADAIASCLRGNRKEHKGYTFECVN